MAPIPVLPSRLGAVDDVRKAQESLRWHPRYRAEAPLPKQPAAVAAAIAARRSEFRAAIAPGGGKLGMSSSMPALGTTTRVWAQDEWVAKTLAACPAGSGTTQLPKLSGRQRQAEASSTDDPALVHYTSQSSSSSALSDTWSPSSEFQLQMQPPQQLGSVLPQLCPPAPDVPGSTAASPALSCPKSPGSRMGSRLWSPNTEWQSQTLASLTARLDETPGSPAAVPAAARSLPSTPASISFVRFAAKAKGKEVGASW
mmetsp:Transcript_67799/g.191934  ORF Transcript_67799/g.191934 Transcript_67799/m.191934 type:complete len:256 (-) Transcript_67799:155-922(-)